MKTGSPTEAVFRIAPDRHEREAKALLGEGFQGIACSDRWWAYDYSPPNGTSTATTTVPGCSSGSTRPSVELKALLEQAARKSTKTR